MQLKCMEAEGINPREHKPIGRFYSTAQNYICSASVCSISLRISIRPARLFDELMMRGTAVRC